MDRRRFLGLFWKGALGFLGLEGLATTYDLLRPRISEGFGAAIPAGAQDALEDGAVRYFADGRFYLSRVEDEVVALYQKCTHLGCRVPYCETSGRFECPCHGSIFNRKGEYIAGPAPRGMDRFPVKVDKGEMVVDTGAVELGPARSVRTLDEEPKGPSCLDQIGHQVEG